MINRIQIREMLAWTVLVLAILIFGFSVSFAQTKSVEVISNNGKVHIKVEQIENGEVVKRDTTISVANEEDIDRIVDDLTGDNSNEQDLDNKNKKTVKKEKKIIIDKEILNVSEEEIDRIREEINEKMKDFNIDLDQMKKSLQDLHIHISNGDDIDLKFPEDGFDRNQGDTQGTSDLSDIIEMDSLIDADHFVIIGEKNEKAPTLEKIVSGKNGKQLFVFRRSESQKDNYSKNEMNELHLLNLRIYPNPSEGKIKVEFYAESQSDFKLQVFNENFKECYTEEFNNIKGDFSKEINLKQLKKGNYLMKISNGKKSLTRKIVLN
jgi:hypothetical protein